MSVDAHRLNALLTAVDPDVALAEVSHWTPCPARTAVEALAYVRSQAWAQAEPRLQALQRQAPWDSTQLVSSKLATCWHAQGERVRALVLLLEIVSRHRGSPQFCPSLWRLASLCVELSMPRHWFDCLERLQLTRTAFTGEERASFDYVCGIVHLFAGDHAAGWARTEARYAAGLAVKPAWPWPELSPQQLGQGRDVLLYADGGFGDLLFGLRFVPALRQQVQSLSLVCDPALVGLMRALDLFDAVDAKPPQGRPLDAWTHLISLPHLLGVTGPAPQWCRPFRLLGEPAWREQLPQAPRTTPLLALNWQGSPSGDSIESFALRGRSFAFAEFERITALQHCDLISVQVGPAAEQIWSSSLADRFIAAQRRLDAPPHTFHKTASLLLGVDLLITNDTSVAHLGGLLGVPTWVLLNDHAYWQWGQQGSTAPWYPSVRCFRQQRAGDWAAVMAEVDAALQSRWRLLRGRGS